MAIIPAVFASLLCVLFLSSMVNVKGNLDANSHQMIINPVFKMKRGSLQIRESENNQANCTELKLFLYGEKYNTECNSSTIDTVFTYLENDEEIPEIVFTTLNNAYARLCAAECIKPIINYYQCLYNGDKLTYYTGYLQSYTCGKQYKDFCPVLFWRQYAINFNNTFNIRRECTTTEFGLYVNCSSATSSCINSISRLKANIGCCTQGLLGDLSACNINPLSEPCASSGNKNSITPALSVVSVIIAIYSKFDAFFHNVIGMQCQLFWVHTQHSCSSII